MAKLVLNIDNYIGPYGYSKQWVTQMLQGHENDEVIVNLSSLGGSVDHALSIHDQFVKHGNVTAVISGFVASATTLIAMGCKKVIMSENAFFLVHKVLGWVDVFGYFNEDDLETIIADLTKKKNENAKITLQLARIYSKRNEKPVKDILSLMKEETWLNAEECIDWGFIDEIEKVSANKVNLLEDMQLVALITCNGLPMPGRKSAPPTVSSTNTSTMNSNFTYLNELLGIAGLESDSEGVYLNTEQLQAINTNIGNNSTENSRLMSENETLTTSLNSVTSQRDAHAETINSLNATVQTLTTERDNANQQLSAAQQELTASNEQISALQAAFDAIDATVASASTPEEKAQAIRNLLASKPGVKPVGTLSTQDPGTANSDDVDWDTINALPHNQLVD